MKIPQVAYMPLAVLSVALPAVARADTTTTTPTIAGADKLTPTGAADTTNAVRFSSIIQTAFNIFLWIATAVAVFYLVYAGFQYITAGGDSEKATKARSAIINAVIGIIIIMAAFFILNAARNAGNNITDNTLGNL